MKEVKIEEEKKIMIKREKKVQKVDEKKRSYTREENRIEYNESICILCFCSICRLQHHLHFIRTIPYKAHNVFRTD